MSDKNMSRRSMIGNSCLAILGAVSGLGFKKAEHSGLPHDVPNTAQELPFRISLNTSTISEYGLTADEQIDMVADAGFDGIEMWIRDIQDYIDAGGTAEALGERLSSRNLVLENMIGFSSWISDDMESREQALDQLRDEMKMVAAMGGRCIAAPVLGIDTLDETKFDDYARRYLAILELGDETGVIPTLEIWGTGALHSIADCAHIALGTGHPNATMLLDFYHFYRGGNDWDTLDLINAGRLPVIHINDYPANPSRGELSDADRIFPGDGICPFNEIIPRLYHAGFRGGFSVELFNREYWESMDAQTILRESYQKTYQTISDTMGNI